MNAAMDRPHYARNGLTDMQEVRHQIKKEMDILSGNVRFSDYTVSVHRLSPRMCCVKTSSCRNPNAYRMSFSLQKK